MNIEINKDENKLLRLSLEEYKVELELMKKQYGQEEELYPWIYMILRDAGITRRYSVRSVAGARSAKDVNGRELFMGYAAFPDIAIVDRSFMSEEEYKPKEEIDKLLCCVEAKGLSETLLSIEGKVYIESSNIMYIKPSTDKPHYKYYKIFNNNEKNFFDEYGGKTFKINKINDKYEITIQKIEKENRKKIKKYEAVDLSIIKDDEKFIIKDNEDVVLTFSSNKNEYTCVDSKNLESRADILSRKEFYLSFHNGCSVVCVDNCKKRLLNDDGTASDYGELIGELLWYGRIIYTNGYIWKYLKISNYNDSIGKIRKDKYDIWVKNNKNHQWCKEFSSKESFIVEVEDLIEIIDYTSESEWECFVDKLSKISSKWGKR